MSTNQFAIGRISLRPMYGPDAMHLVHRRRRAHVMTKHRCALDLESPNINFNVKRVDIKNDSVPSACKPRVSIHENETRRSTRSRVLKFACANW